MKNIFTVFLLLAFASSVVGQRMVAHEGISLTNIDVSSETTVGEVSLETPGTGWVMVRFDGYCISTPGDRVVLAASNTPSWGVNDGNVGVEAVNNDINGSPFSHTRVYPVAAGNHSFFAVAHNYVETDGDGKASIYGSLTATFVPADAGTIAHVGIQQTNLDVTTEMPVAQVSINVATAGRAIVHFDGTCINSPGDRIVLAASNTPSWGVNDGNVSVEAIDNDLNSNCFSHTRAYDVGPGNHTFYAVAHNYVETAGNGLASIYGSLTVEFIPSGSDAKADMVAIQETSLDLNNSQVIGTLNFNPTQAGKVIVQFDGQCLSSPGDRIVLAASNSTSWGVNDGSLGVEAYTDDFNRHSFSHTRVYDVTPGNHTFYAVAHNYVETDGNGIASIYGSLTGQFIPNEGPSGTENLAQNWQISLFPNPTSGGMQLKLPADFNRSAGFIQLFNAQGQILQQWDAAQFNGQIDLTQQATGMYLIKVIDQDAGLFTTQTAYKIQ